MINNELIKLINVCELVIFDVDDTLLYTFMNGFKKVLAVAEILNFDPISFNRFFSVYGKLSFEECINFWYPHANNNIFTELYKKVSISFPYEPICDFSEIQKKIINKNIKVGILTNGKKELKLYKKLNVANVIIEKLDYLYTRDDVIEVKPSGLSFQLIKEKSKLSNKKIIYIGDSYVDFLASKEAGINFIGVSTGVTNWHNYSNILFMDSINELITLLEN